MTPYLKQLAQHFFSKHRHKLHNYRFFMPNRRAGVFFMHYLSEQLTDDNDALFAPEITTLSDFIAQESQLILADDLPVIFEIFKIYREIRMTMGKQQEEEHISFDNFYPIGELLLQDFNDIDKHLVDADKIFRTTIELKEIDQIFDSDEINSAKEKFKNTALFRTHSSFFRNNRSEKSIDELSSEEKELMRHRFLEFWSHLNTIYNKLRKELIEQGIAYQGLLLRNFVKEHNVSEFNRDKINVFIGMNALTPCEVEILEQFKRIEGTLFYWDYDLPLLKNDLCSYFIKENREKFPEPEGADKIDFSYNGFPTVEAVSIPSAAAQTRFIGQELEKLAKSDEGIEQINSLQTLIVLPDEHILMPMFSNIPESISDVNVTMGYPLKDSPVVAMLENLIKILQRSTTTDRNTENNEVLWPTKDLLNLLSTGTLYDYFEPFLEEITQDIYRNKRYSVTTYLLLKLIDQSDGAEEKTLENKKDVAKSIITSILPVNGLRDEQDQGGALLQIVINLITFLLEVDYDDPDDLNDDDPLNDNDGRPVFTIESVAYPQLLSLLTTLQKQVSSISSAEGSIDVSLVVDLLRTLFRNTRIPFAGEPLKGLQVMGFLETRSLDFSTIFIPDVSEGILPTKKRIIGIIPYILRIAHNLPTYEWQDRSRAYHFFRLLSRAQRVVLTYDSRRTQSSEGEPSRYIRMLKYLFPKKDDPTQSAIKIDSFSANYPLRTLAKPSISCDLRKDIVHKYLDELSDNDTNKRALSASNINSFIQCPRRFYYTTICGLDEQDKLDELMDDAELGTIIHNTLQKLYARFENKQLKTSELTNILSEKNDIKKLVEQSYKQLMYKSGGVNTKRLDEIRLNVAERMVCNVINKDLDLLKDNHTIKYIRGEHKFVHTIRLDNNRQLKIKGFIDRLDILDGKILRVIDFKTGRDKYDIDLRSLKDRPLKQFNRAVVQLLFYCWAIKNNYANLPQFDNIKLTLQPIINKPLDRNNSGELTARVEDKIITSVDFDKVDEKYSNFINDVMEEITTPDQAYPANPDPDSYCKYCPARTLCLANQYEVVEQE